METLQSNSIMNLWKVKLKKGFQLNSDEEGGKLFQVEGGGVTIGDKEGGGIKE